MHDGHSLLFTTHSTFTVVPLLHTKVPYDPVGDVRPVSLAVEDFLAVVTAELRRAEEPASLLGIQLVPLAARTPGELQALAPAALSDADGLIVLPDAMFWNNRATIINILSMALVPAIYSEREYADDGGLMAYGPNAPEHFRQAAGYVDRILRGAKSGDLPINASSKFDFVINLRTARTLGLTLSPDSISAADEVIE
jgi:putative ABC transport system substrate-binding protein